jgi:hypothetical protein
VGFAENLKNHVKHDGIAANSAFFASGREEKADRRDTRR